MLRFLFYGLLGFSLCELANSCQAIGYGQANFSLYFCCQILFGCEGNCPRWLLHSCSKVGNENSEMHLSFVRWFANNYWSMHACLQGSLAHCAEICCSLFLCHILCVIQFQNQVFKKLWIFSCLCAECKGKICYLHFSLL